jgi:hypothetical protein
MMTTVSLRLATAPDRPALDLLATLDSAQSLDGSVLVAEAGGSVRAARSLRDGRTIANPFAPTADLVVLLAARAALLRGAPSQRSRGPGGLRRLLQARPAQR